VAFSLPLSAISTPPGQHGSRSQGTVWRFVSYMVGGRSSHQNVDGSNLDSPIEKWMPNFDSAQNGNQVRIKYKKTGPSNLAVNTPIECPQVWDLQRLKRT
jgi:hypothetical protein